MIVIHIGVIALALVFLGACWYLDEVSLRTKIVFTVLYLASWGLFLLPPEYNFIFTLAQIVLIVVIGVATFGLDWLIGKG